MSAKEKEKAPEETSQPTPSQPPSSQLTPSLPTPSQPTPPQPPQQQPASPLKRALEFPTNQIPAKKQSKWTAEEDERLIQLRGAGLKWEEISKHLPGRSPISCRLHYQNYLERRSEWDEERKNQLAVLYERLKPQMWKLIEDQMKVPWRAIEAMHWKIGEDEMARRAGVPVFSTTSSIALEPSPKSRRSDAARKDKTSGTSGSIASKAPSASDSIGGNPASKS